LWRRIQHPVGYTGLLNLSSITFVGIGGYVAMVIALPPPGNSGMQYILGLDGRFPSLFWWRWWCARCWAQSSVHRTEPRPRLLPGDRDVLRRRDRCIRLVSTYIPLFDGKQRPLWPQPPFSNVVGLANYNDLYLGLCVVILAIVFLFAERCARVPSGGRCERSEKIMMRRRRLGATCGSCS